jgi:hypothetical protein
MAHKKKHVAAVPPGNRPQHGPAGQLGGKQIVAGEVGSAQEHDPKQRMGDYDGKAEHSMQEPGGKNGANH